MTRLVRLVAALACVAAILVAAPAVAHDDGGQEIDAIQSEGVGNPAFNESHGCGQPSTSNPLATKTGGLADTELVRGFKGDFFGRSIGAVKGQLVPWTIPMSGGHVLNVHERALPAFQLVTANLVAEEANGNFYDVRPEHTYGFLARTVGGRHSISNHALGTAVDVNSTTNPYSSSNALITDMPDWYVKAWTDAGFCWGGDWVDVKDPMHFSWMGPDATPGYGELPDSHPVTTTAAKFTDVAVTWDVPYGPLEADRHYVVTDATGNGLADVYQVSQLSFGLQMDYARSHRLQMWCAVDRVAIEDVDLDGRTIVFGDHEQNGRTDLWLLDTDGATLDIQVVLRSAEFEESVEVATAIATSPNDVYLVADHDRDGVVDLYVVRRSASSTTLEVWDGAGGYQTKQATLALGLGGTLQDHFAVGDRDLDELPDVYVLGGGELRIVANGETSPTETLAVPSPAGLHEIAVNDFDGDGRDDLFTLTDAGVLSVRLGNTRLAGETLTSWFVPEDYECPEGAPAYDYQGLFRDDDGTTHEPSIDAIGAEGITKGCNPPFNDEYCPTAAVTRGQMAAFLDRALGLSDTSVDFFDDDDGTTFEANINRLAAARITLGCNPPANDAFCASAKITRGQMAAFLVRGFELTGGAGGDLFVDDDSSIFEADIDVLGTSGVTLGCNPPANDRYCPSNNVTRAQMASFLVRALDGQDA